MLFTLKLCTLGVLTCLTAGAFGQQTPDVPHGEHINVVFKAVSEAEVFRPAIGKPGTWPGIVLVSDDTGLDDFLRARALDLASKGFLVVAVDPRRTMPDTISEEFRHKRAMEELGGAISYLNSWMMSPDRVGIVGYGTGGTLALDFALADDSVRAVVVNYGTLHVQNPGVTQAHFTLLANLGALDPCTTPNQTAEALTRLHALHVTTTIKTYPNAGHAFDRPGDAAYKAEDVADQQKRTIAFITSGLRRVAQSPGL
jgi:carboxymethylenebutenolidase